MTVAGGMRFAQVVVHSPGGSTARTGEVAASEVDQSPHLQGFHYEIPEGMEVLPGHLVWVPFGRRELPGIVLGRAESSPVERTKPLLALIDPEPVLRPYQLALMRWIAGYYRTPLHRVAWSMFPRELSWTPEWSVSLRDDATAEVALSAGEQGLVDYLRSGGRRVSLILRLGLRQVTCEPGSTDWCAGIAAERAPGWQGRSQAQAGASGQPRGAPQPEASLRSRKHYNRNGCWRTCLSWARALVIQCRWRWAT